MPMAMGAGLGVLAGAVTAGVGVLLLVRALRLEAATYGTVVGHDRSDSEDATSYYPRVAFATEGREGLIRGQIGHGRPQPPVGARVQVYLPPGDPQAAEFGRAVGVWVAVAATSAGAVLAGVAAWELVQD